MALYNFSNSNDYALSGYYAGLGHGSGFAGIGGDQQIAFCTHSGVVRCTHSVYYYYVYYYHLYTQWCRHSKSVKISTNAFFAQKNSTKNA